MGVDVLAALFVGLPEGEIPENTRELLEGKVEMYEGWEEELDEDSSLYEWIEYIEKIPGSKWDLGTMREGDFVGFNIACTFSLEILSPDEIAQDIAEATEAFQRLFGVSPKMYLFTDWC